MRKKSAATFPAKLRCKAHSTPVALLDVASLCLAWGAIRFHDDFWKPSFW